MKENALENFREERADSLMLSNWAKRLNECPIDVIEENKDITLEEIKENYSGKVAVLDLYIKDIEKMGQWEGNAMRIYNILSIDHHAPIEEFSKNISTTNLAIEWVNKNGILDKNYSVVINHIDCDSLLSSLIVRGILLPHERFGNAAISADHTGEENKIADLLQALQDTRNLEFSIRNLELLLKGKELDLKAQKLLDKTYIDKKRAKEVVEKGKMNILGRITYVQLDKKIESSYFPALIPDAQVILTFSPHLKNPDHWESKIRLGLKAPAGLTIGKLEIEDIDPSFGYRWNAGGNSRGSGTTLKLEEYANRLNEKLQKYLGGKKE